MAAPPSPPALTHLASSSSSSSSSARFVTRDEYPYDTYPVFAFGVGYIAQAPIVRYIAGHQEMITVYPLEDVSMGTWVKKAADAGVQVEYVNSGGVTNMRTDNCRGMYVTHYVPPDVMICWWERLKDEDFCSGNRPCSKPT